MTDKERLEKAKKILNHIKGYGVYDGNDDIEIFEWLIEQAERVQELENRIADDEHFVAEILEQNKRYREALEFYANRQAYYHTNEHQAEIMLDYGNRARKALEGEE